LEKQKFEAFMFGNWKKTEKTEAKRRFGAVF
jgi:hypothetical protein